MTTATDIEPRWRAAQLRNSLERLASRRAELEAERAATPAAGRAALGVDLLLSVNDVVTRANRRELAEIETAP
jgi:hypothetical protein